MNWRKIKVLIVGLIIIYAFFTFITWEYNLAEWSIFTRIIFGALVMSAFAQTLTDP